MARIDTKGPVPDQPDYGYNPGTTLPNPAEPPKPGGLNVQMGIEPKVLPIDLYDGMVPRLTRQEFLAQKKMAESQRNSEAYLSMGDLEVARLLRERQTIYQQRTDALMKILGETEAAMGEAPPAPRQTQLSLGNLLGLLAGGLAGGEFGAQAGATAINRAEQTRQELMQSDRAAWESRQRLLGLKYDATLKQLFASQESVDRVAETSIQNLAQQVRDDKQWARRKEEMDLQFQQQAELLKTGNEAQQKAAIELEQFRAMLRQSEGDKELIQKLVTGFFDEGLSSTAKLGIIATLKKAGYEPTPEMMAYAQIDGSMDASRKVLSMQRMKQLEWADRLNSAKVQSLLAGAQLSEAQISNMSAVLALRQQETKLDMFKIWADIVKPGTDGGIKEYDAAIAASDAKLKTLSTELAKMLPPGVKFEDVMNGNFPSGQHPQMDAVFQALREEIVTNSGLRAARKTLGQKGADPSLGLQQVFGKMFGGAMPLSGPIGGGGGGVPPFNPMAAPGVQVSPEKKQSPDKKK